MTLDRRIAALECAAPPDPVALLVDFVRPGETQPRLTSATPSGTVLQRLDDEADETFMCRARDLALRARQPGCAGIAFLHRGERT